MAELTQLFGQPIHGEPTPITKIMRQKDSMFDVIIEGVIFGLEIRGPWKNGNRLYSAAIYDNTTSMYFKFFHSKEFKLKDGQFLRMRGKVEFDTYKKELVFEAMHLMQGEAPKSSITDDAEEKRGELAFLSKMSRHRSTLAIDHAIKLAKAMGHKFLGLTDYDVAQGYPEAYNVSKKEDFKIVYGLTMNMVDDSQPVVFNATDERIDEVSYTVWDFETTGLSTEDDDLIELGATRFEPYKGHYCSACKEFFPLESKEEREEMVKTYLMKNRICPSCLGKKKKNLFPQIRIEVGVGLLGELELEEVGLKEAHEALTKEIKKNNEDTSDELTEVINVIHALENVETEKERRKLEKEFDKLAKRTLNEVTHRAVGQFREIIYTDKEITPFITKLTGHTQEIVNEGKPVREVIEAFDAFYEGTVLVAHNAPFDKDMLESAYKRLGKAVPTLTVLDTLQLARVHRKDLGKHGLGPLSKAYEIELENHHRADEDAQATGEILIKMIVELLNKGITTLNQLNDMRDEEYFLNIFPTKQIRIWVKTQKGLKNLYNLISASHTTYLNRTTPTIPKRIVDEFREDLLIGSAGINGDLFELALNKMPEQVEQAIDWYDVIEIQPSELASHYPRQNRAHTMESIDRTWKTIYDLAKAKGKLIVATGEAQYETKEDRMAQHMLLYKAISSMAHDKSAGRLENMEGFAHFRTTHEMLEELAWLSPEEAHELVVTNPNKVADMCETLQIIPDKLYTPKIEGANEELENMVMDRAHELYGKPLPEYVAARIDKELKAILGYGFGVVYLISQKLVKNSVDNGYLVGSRGSVGSSLVATMMGITEVNPLKPHYYCMDCHWSVFFDNEEIQSGYDLPRNIQVLFDKEKYTEKAQKHVKNMLQASLGEEQVEQAIHHHKDDVCPCCGKDSLKRDGQDIPFETFLGFKGDKVPDIDLNFSGEYQGTTHRYVEELFGSEYVYRAGTVGTVADKTAFGYVKAYLEGHTLSYQEHMSEIREQLKQPESPEEKERHVQELEELQEKTKALQWSAAEIGRLSGVIEGSRRTSGQHPGGMLVVPDYMDIHDFTPYQYPANQRFNKDTGEENQQTSHFDFHAIHDNILKLDILGHDDPTELRMLQDLTGIDPKTVPANDEKVLKLFTNAEEAGIPLSRIEAKTGTLGVPEFGTKFVQEMILDTKPTTFAELVKISGLSHGTDVWLNNAKDLIVAGTITLKEVIDTRDNIMVGLIQRGLEESLAFTIMESVRKGKGLTPEMEAEMKAKNVEDWYIDSCKKIKYMFPKAHAAAYVLSALRIAYFKVYYPIEYYAAHLSVRYPNQDITEIVKDSDMIRTRIKDLEGIMERKNNARPKQAITKEKELHEALNLVLEAKERGIKFAPPRLYGSTATKYLIEGDTLIAPFESIPGIGRKAAEKLNEQAQRGIFRGVEDLKSRAEIGDATVDILRQMGCLELVEEMQHTLY